MLGVNILPSLKSNAFGTFLNSVSSVDISLINIFSAELTQLNREITIFFLVNF